MTRLIKASLTLFSILLMHDAYARAGGGFSGGGFSSFSSYGSSGGGDAFGGIMVIVVAIVMFVFLAFGGGYAVRKRKECKELHAKLAKIDDEWQHDRLKKHIEKTYYLVQEAWRDRDQQHAKPYMSERLYNRHQEKIDRMIRNNEKNEMHHIKLLDAQIIEIMDFLDDAKDKFTVQIHGSMVDYMINENDDKAIPHKINTPDFKELWVFTREQERWVLDEIKYDINDFRASWSEAV